MTRTLLELDLTRGVLDPPPASPLAALRARNVPSLRELVMALRRARDDENVAGLIAHLSGPPLSLAQTQELRDAVSGFREAGKPAVAWAESFGEVSPGTVPYYLATAFEEIWLQPSGELGFTGVSVDAVFLRGALDKAGVVPQFGKRREYKTAADTFMEKEMTGPAREMASRLAASAYEQIVAGVADRRKLTEDEVRALVDRAPLAAEAARDAGLIDRLGYRTDVYDAVRARCGEAEPKLLERYERKLRPKPADLLQRNRPVVAVVRVSGGISLGRSGGGGPFGGRTGAGSDTICAALRAVGQDKRVQAAVLRVDSPGGSYVASDAIRDEVLRLRSTGRPVVASMGSVAASGGYFVAMPADVIVAQPGTITGSIGVLTGKGVLRDALAKVGIAREGVAEGRNARMYSSQQEFSDDQWKRLDEILDRIYDDFVTKAATDRGLPHADLEQVARGRVWTGADALSHSLVDELGGLERAVELACARAGLGRNDVAVRALPHRNPLDRLKPPETTDDLAVRTAPALPTGADGIAAAVYTALGLPPVGVLTMPLTWQIT